MTFSDFSLFLSHFFYFLFSFAILAVYVAMMTPSISPGSYQPWPQSANAGPPQPKPLPRLASEALIKSAISLTDIQECLEKILLTSGNALISKYPIYLFFLNADVVMINSLVEEILAFYGKSSKVRSKSLTFLSVNCGIFIDQPICSNHVTQNGRTYSNQKNGAVWTEDPHRFTVISSIRECNVFNSQTTTCICKICWRV